MQVFFPINGAQFEEPTDGEKTIMDREQRLSPKQALDAFAAAELPLMMNPLSVFKREGFADVPDDEKANEELSEERALIVARYLKAVIGRDWTHDQSLVVYRPKRDPDGPGGVAPQRIAVVGHGEVSTGTNDYRQADRRVDLSCRTTDLVGANGEESPIQDLKATQADTRATLLRKPTTAK